MRHMLCRTVYGWIWANILWHLWGDLHCRKLYINCMHLRCQHRLLAVFNWFVWYGHDSDRVFGLRGCNVRLCNGPVCLQRVLGWNLCQRHWNQLVSQVCSWIIYECYISNRLLFM